MKTHPLSLWISFSVMFTSSPHSLPSSESWDLEIFTPKRCLVLLFSALRWCHPKGNQSWIFTGKTDVEAETPILWPPDVKNWLIWKDPDAGKDWRQEEKGVTENEMVGWHHPLSGHEFEQTPGNSEGQGILVCWSSWSHKETQVNEWTTTAFFMVQISHLCMTNGKMIALTIQAFVGKVMYPLICYLGLS